ncbi:host attachment protein [Aquisalimonas sp.]|uniref:host attachment protein n=1 Tax=Aquisalimonas sp. TaxID=1872621 RepID=UPI0025C656B7|nr:host attachment protein [Aquisalimonas sp.]
MKSTWVVVANRARARFFSLSSPKGPLTEVQDLVHPEGRLHDQDINADRPGRSFDTSGKGRHAMGKRHSPSEQEAIRFAHTVGDQLAKQHYEGAFERLVLTAPPHFLGLLRDALPAAVTESIVMEIDKDLAAVERTDEIRELLPERL